MLELLQVLEACLHLGSFQGLSVSSLYPMAPWPMTTDYVSVCNVQQTYQFQFLIAVLRREPWNLKWLLGGRW